MDVGILEFECRDSAPEKGDQTPVPRIWDIIRVTNRTNQVINRYDKSITPKDKEI